MQGCDMMKVGFEPRKLCQWLLILTWITYSASQNCTDDSECRLFTRCNPIVLSNDKICACLYSVSTYYRNGTLEPCLDHCRWDTDCPSFAECEMLSSGNRCKCKYGGPIYNGPVLNSCNNYCKQDTDCRSYADCDERSSGNRCTCKFGGSYYSGAGVKYSCYFPVWEIAGGVIGGIAFIAIIGIIIFYFKRRRQRFY